MKTAHNPFSLQISYDFQIIKMWTVEYIKHLNGENITISIFHNDCLQSTYI